MGSDKEVCTSKLSVCGLGVGLAVSWGFGIFVMGLLSWLFGYGTAMVAVFSSVYIGYAPTFIGMIVGTIWGLVDGFIAGVIIAFIYNWVVKCHHCKLCCGKSKEVSSGDTQ